VITGETRSDADFVVVLGRRSVGGARSTRWGFAVRPVEVLRPREEGHEGALWGRRPLV